MTPPAAGRPSLPRVLGLWDGLGMLVGVVVGLGILRTPGIIAGALGDARWILAIWLAAGATAALSTLVFAELSAMMPEAGGKYAYARTAFGETAGFTVGVLELVGVRLLLAASKAAVIGVYLTDLFHGGNARLLTTLTVAAFLALHLRGVRTGATVQNGITLVKVLVLLAIVTICFAWGGRGAAPPSPAPPKDITLLGVALAWQAVWFTYYGWEDIVKMAEDIRDPGRNMPRILLGGSAIVILLYMLVNLGFLHALSPAEMAGSTFVARDAIQSALGSAAGAALTVGGLIILIGGLNANFMGLPRIPFALARDGLAPAGLVRLDRRQTPVASLVTISLVVLVVALSGTVEWLIRFVTIIALTVDGIVVLSLFVLRRRRPDLARPYRVPLYPLTPALVAVLYAAILSVIVGTQPSLALGAAGLVVLTVLAGRAAGRYRSTRSAS